MTACGKSEETEAKFTQTWPTAYAQITCRQWLDDMTSEQRFTAAADILVGAQSTDDAGADLPSDDLINSFAADISEGCGPVATMAITDTSISIYGIGRDQCRP